MDNLFVFTVIMATFAVPRAFQQKLLLMAEMEGGVGVIAGFSARLAVSVSPVPGVLTWSVA